MSVRGLGARVAGEERGGILVMTAISLPLVILLATLVIDVGNWFEHRRHLQLQADAAVLAAAADVTYPCDNDAIKARAAQYGGLAPLGGQGPYNTQVGGTPAENVNAAFNSPTWPGQSSPVDSEVRTGEPCAASMIDLKLTEDDLPYFFRLASVAHINAHARVEINKATQLNNFIPVSVIDQRWKRGEATFFDETPSTRVEIGRRQLVKQGVNGAGQAVLGTETPLPVTFGAGVDRVGVRVAVSTNDSTTCGEAGVRCYEKVLFIRGYEGAPAVSTGAAPKARDVRLVAGSCNDGAFTTTATFSGSSCTVGIQATVDWGTTTPLATYDATLTARLADGTPVPLTLSGGVWTGTLTVPPSGGPLNVSMSWRAEKGTIDGTACGTGKGRQPQPCTGTFGVVQRTFSSSSTASGPIDVAQLWEGGGYGVHSFRQCDSGNASCTRDLDVKIAVPGTLANAQSVSDPIYRMRSLDDSSQTQAIDCDENLSTLEDEFALGCSSPGYVVNTGQSCAGYNNPGALPDPSPCSVTQTGATQSQIGKGLNRRILGDAKPTACTAPNNWADFPNFDRGDPRVVFVILTPYESFTGSGNEAFPVVEFAAFYITGWQGNPGFDNPCQGNGDDHAERGEIVGHFIKYVQIASGGGGSGGEPCDLSSDGIGVCITELTR